MWPAQPRMWPAPTARANHPYAIASLVAALLGVTVVPVLGALVGAGLGAAALRAMRNEPGRWDGRSFAIAGLAIGLALGAVPMVGLFAAFWIIGHQLWALPMLALAVAYGAVILVVGTRGSRPALAASAAGIAGGVVALGLAILLAIGISILFIEGIEWLIRYIFYSTKCAVTHGGGTGKHCTPVRK
jgi:hypothetical protein